MARVQVGLEKSPLASKDVPLTPLTTTPHIWREIMHPAGPPMKPNPFLLPKYRPGVKQGTMKGFLPTWSTGSNNVGLIVWFCHCLAFVGCNSSGLWGLGDVSLSGAGGDGRVQYERHAQLCDNNGRSIFHLHGIYHPCGHVKWFRFHCTVEYFLVHRGENT